MTAKSEKLLASVKETGKNWPVIVRTWPPLVLNVDGDADVITISTSRLVRVDEFLMAPFFDWTTMLWDPAIIFPINHFRDVEVAGVLGSRSHLLMVPTET